MSTHSAAEAQQIGGSSIKDNQVRLYFTAGQPSHFHSKLENTHSAPSVSVIRVVLQKQKQPRLVVGCGERARDSHLGSSAITSKFKEEFEHEFPQHRMHCSAAALFCTVMSHRLPKPKYNIPNSCNPVRMAPLPDDAGHVHGFPQLGLSFESGRNLLRFRSPEFGTDQKTPSL